MNRGKISLILVVGFFFFGISHVNAKNMIKAYTYDQKNEATKCITGKENTCQRTTCYEKMEANSCAPGTIIDYQVNDQEVIRFHVISDQGKTLTMQTQQNMIEHTAWYKDSNDNSKGPITALEGLEKIVANWMNVNTQTYTLGETVFQTNAYTGCDENNTCSSVTYKLPIRTTNVRLITIQELAMLGCTTTVGSCPIWTYNYLTSSTSFGGTENASSSAYWTMSAISSTVGEAWWIYCNGKEDNTYVNNIYSGARAVVVVNKESKEIENQNSNNPNKSQTVKIEDTLKKAYVIYCIGSVILVVGLIIFIQALRKKKITDAK